MSDPWEFGWSAIGSVAGAIGTIVTTGSIVVAVLVFRRDARLREFEICDRLEKETAALWREIRNDSQPSNITDLVQRVFDHYERCALYLNQFRFLKGRAAQSLEQTIIEVVRREIGKPHISKALKSCCSSPETYKELKLLLLGHNIILPVGFDA